MIRSILKQLSRRRRATVWLLCELILVAYFMWGVIDPAYVLLSNRAIPRGMNIERSYIMTLTTLMGREEYLKKTAGEKWAAVEQMAQVLRNQPKVEEVLIPPNFDVPYPHSRTVTHLNYDSLHIETEMTQVLPHEGFFRFFNIRDARTGSILRENNNKGLYIYISEDIARKISIDYSLLMDQEVAIYGGLKLKIAGVFSPVKMLSEYEQPKPLVFVQRDVIHDNEDLPSVLVIRAKQGVNPAQFIEYVLREVKPEMEKNGIFGIVDMWNLEDVFDQLNNQNGKMNKLRLYTGMSAFFLLCVFLGMAGTFWLNGRSRRGEIGLRMAMGSTKRRILKEFLTESALLTTIAWLIGIIIVLQRVMYNGFAEAPAIPNDMYIQNRPVPHFLIVSGIVYVLMMLMALFGTWIPAQQAARTEPSDALRDDN